MRKAWIDRRLTTPVFLCGMKRIVKHSLTHGIVQMNKLVGQICTMSVEVVSLISTANTSINISDIESSTLSINIFD